jgi:hypothetical protein
MRDATAQCKTTSLNPRNINLEAHCQIMFVPLYIARFLLVASLLLLVSCATHGDNERETAKVQHEANNSELQQILEADQADRQVGTQPDWSVIGRRDEERFARVKEILLAEKLRTSTDYYNAALVCQHGGSVEDIRLAHALATISRTIDPKDLNAAWLFAASWDRIMMQLEKPQWYGTQFTKSDMPGSKWELYKMDEMAVTDDDRKKLGLPSLQEARERANKMNEPQK